MKNQGHTQEQLNEHAKLKTLEIIENINTLLARIRESGHGMVRTKLATQEEDSEILLVHEITFPSEGGILTHFNKKGVPPLKGFFVAETIETVDDVKKTIMAIVKGFVKEFERNKIGTILSVILFRKGIKEILTNLLVELDYRLRDVRYKPRYYCKVVWAFYAAFEQLREKYPKWKDELLHGRNIICMILEGDNAYRFRPQAVLPEMDKEAIQKNVIKELKRVIDIWIEKETGIKENAKEKDLIKTHTAGQLLKLKKVISLLRFCKEAKVMLRDFFLFLDLNEVKFDKADYYHAFYGKQPYNWKH